MAISDPHNIIVPLSVTIPIVRNMCVEELEDFTNEAMKEYIATHKAKVVSVRRDRIGQLMDAHIDMVEE